MVYDTISDREHAVSFGALLFICFRIVEYPGEKYDI